MGTKCPMSLDSLCFIKPCNSHHPFVLSHTNTTPLSTPLLMQTTHHPPTPHTILTNYAPPINSHYQPPTFCVNVNPQPNIFSIPLNNAHIRPFPPSILLAPIVAHDQTPQSTPTLPTQLQPPPKPSCPTCGCQFTL
jgi:hypothetical protein